jgi:hypothetical protein
MPLNPCRWILTEKTEYFGKRLQNEGTTTLLQNLHSTQNHLHSARTLPLSLARMLARTNDPPCGGRGQKSQNRSFWGEPFSRRLILPRNPVKRGLVDMPEKVRWSSYRFCFLDEHDRAHQ